jgi:hypothetical protein
VKRKSFAINSAPKVYQGALLGLLGFSERFSRLPILAGHNGVPFRKASVRVALQVVP